MKNVIIIGAVGLVAYYVYQQTKNPNTTPSVIANDTINQVANFVNPTNLPVLKPVSDVAFQSQPSTVFDQPILVQPITSTPIIQPIVVQPVTTTVQPTVINSVPKRIPLSVAISNLNKSKQFVSGLRGLL